MSETNGGETWTLQTLQELRDSTRNEKWQSKESIETLNVFILLWLPPHHVIPDTTPWEQKNSDWSEKYTDERKELSFFELSGWLLIKFDHRELTVSKTNFTVRNHPDGDIMLSSQGLY